MKNTSLLIQQFVVVSLLTIIPLFQVDAAEHSNNLSKTMQSRKVLQTVLSSLQPAIVDLMNTYGERYPHGDQFLSELKFVSDRVNHSGQELSDALCEDVLDLQRRALLDNPLVSSQPILFTARPQYLSDHHSTATLFQNGEINTDSFRGGSALRILNVKTGSVQTLVDCPNGIVRDPEIHYDGKRAVFSMRNSIDDDYHIYELDLQNIQFKQLTTGSELSDIDPVYLPNDEIAFVSTREPKYCQCNRHIMGNIFIMDFDGSNIHQIGKNTLFEGHPFVMPDGRVLYDRWEYVDKHFGPAFGLWTCNPDGTNHAIYYGNNAWSPGAVMDARIVPETDQVIATLGSCHDRPWGAIAIIDRNLGLDGMNPIVHSWPREIRSYMTHDTDYKNGTQRNHPAGGQIDHFKRLSIKYEDAYPLSKKYFLCSRTVEEERTGLFLLDVFGNELCLYEEEIGCFDPRPIQPVPRQHVIPSRVDYTKKEGYFYVSNVYEGTGMKTVKHGSVKTLRVVEAPVKLFWTQTNWNLDATQAPAMNFNATNNKRILGDVPVEADGSAYFAVPADTFVYFQLLDQSGKMIQSMRSGTIVRPGETLGCVGCHDNRLSAPLKYTHSLALQRSSSQIKPWYGSARDFNYLTEVQPVFDRHCVDCHDYGKEAGNALNLSGDLGLVFNTSYLELRRKSALRWFRDTNKDEKLLVKAVDDGPPEALEPYSWGSHRSRLLDVIQEDHYGIKLDPESIDRIQTWVDMNAPYYGSYASVYPDNVFGRSPLDDAQITELRALTGVDVGKLETELQGSQCNFTRPELSPCLIGLQQKNEANYQKALSIIRIGKSNLTQKPRMDMPGTQLLDADQTKLIKYRAQIKSEKQTQSALLYKKQ